MNRTYTWDARNLPRRVSKGSTWEEFDYGPEGQRWKQWDKGASSDSWTYYAADPGGSGALFESYIPGPNWQHRRYIRAGGELVAISLGGPGATEPVRYIHNDHLGSIIATSTPDTSSNGTPNVTLTRHAYDAWGKRRNASNWADDQTPAASSNPEGTERGFTGHEHLASGITHMNGRVYDPLVGRFMSPDPYIQDATDTQAFNRYSYVGNNPLAYTDPSGLLKVGKLFKKVFKHLPLVIAARTVGKILLKAPILRAAASVALAVFVPGGAYWAAALNTYLAALSGQSFGEVLKVGIINFASAAAFSAIGGAEGMSAGAKLAASAAVGCAGGLAGGGGARGCAGGAISASVGATGSGTFNGGELILRSVVGGAVAKLTGGKFEIGALTAAMSYIAATAGQSGDRAGANSESGGGGNSGEDYWERNKEGGTGWRGGYSEPAGVQVACAGQDMCGVQLAFDANKPPGRGPGDNLGPCEYGFYQCVNTGQRLHDMGYQRESNQLFIECRKSLAQCHANENTVQSTPGVKAGLTAFPPNEKNNGGGWVFHEKGREPRYVPPYYDPLANLPPK